MTQASSTELRDAIVAANESFRTTSKTGDAAGMAALYTESGTLSRTISERLLVIP
jgi:ketosteroid isomerase-like protein